MLKITQQQKDYALYRLERAKEDLESAVELMRMVIIVRPITERIIPSFIPCVLH